MKTVLFVFGTRPEAIKMAPLIETFSKDSNFKVVVGITAQHREMLDQVLDFFEVKVDYDLNIMKPNQTLHQLTADLISQITSEILLKEKVDYLFVQGDTTTVLAASLAAFYQKIKIIHIEAGLRSHNMQSPFPEEMNRVLTTRLAEYHFCPTKSAADNLSNENITQNVHVVGNTVIDALFIGLEKLKAKGDNFYLKMFSNIDFSKKIILVTCHRRENFGKPFEQICSALTNLADTFENDIQIIYPVHLNPNIRKNAAEYLQRKNITLIEPLDYPSLLWIMNKSYLIITDSGGIQEEAPSLGKPVIVMREETERMEGVDAGTAILVGSDESKIILETSRLLNDSLHYKAFSEASNPYGDGLASEKIKAILAEAAHSD